MLGVVIPHHSQRTHLLKAVASVREFTTVVVDDSLRGGLTLDGVTVIRTSGHEGFARAANAGLEEVARQGMALALVLNDDACMHPGSIDLLLSEWRDMDGALAPVLHEADGTVYGIAVSKWGRARLLRQPETVQALSGACLMIRSSERFDPQYAHGFEDIELCRRLRQRGLEIRVVAASGCDHVGGGSIDRRSRGAQRAAMAGHLRYLGGGLRGGIAVGLGLAQVLSEGASPTRLLGLVEGIKDHLKGRPVP